MTSAASTTSVSPILPRDCVQYVMQFTDPKTTLLMFLVCRGWYHAVDRVVLLVDRYYYFPETYVEDIIRRDRIPACVNRRFNRPTTLQDDVRWGYVKVMVLDTLYGNECFPPTLTSLYLCERYWIQDYCLAGVSALTSLTSLDLAGCGLITDVGLAHLLTLRSLTSLSLRDCVKITDAGLAHLSQLRSLTSLNLATLGSLLLDKKITDAGLAHLSTLNALSILILKDCSEITDAGLAHLSTMTSLTAINISGCWRITDAGRKHVSRLRLLDRDKDR